MARVASGRPPSCPKTGSRPTSLSLPGAALTCCAPARSDGSALPAATTRRPSARARLERYVGHERWVELPGGTFLMGSADPDANPADGEGPIRVASVEPFAIDRYAITNREFAAFVAETGYVTDAERYGASFVFAGFLPDDAPPTRAVAAAPWWREVVGAAWCRPEGPGSTVSDRLDHPVVHVSWRDANAFCRWAGVRLPTETEWEYAARGGLEGRRFPWGDELEPGGEHRCNIWQGVFPSENTGADGWIGTAPVDAFAPNGFGLHNVCGNVWEWCANRFTPAAGLRAIRGGSYLCHASYCNRYRVAARSGNTPDSSTGNTGFRVVRC